MRAVLFALCASLCWGSGDLLAGLGSRRASAWSVSLVSQAAGLAVGVALLVALDRSWIGWAALWPSLGAGVLLSLGMVAYYQGLAVGTMSVVAPIASVGVIVPVVLGLARGEQPSPFQMAGVVAAIVGVALASYERRHRGAIAGTIEVGVGADATQPGDDASAARVGRVRRNDRLAALLAGFAAACFGFVLVGFSETAGHDPLYPAVGGRATAVILLSAFVVGNGLREGRREVAAGGVGSGVARLGRFVDLPASVVPMTIVAGVLHLGAATLYSFASTEGLLSLVSVLSSLTAVVVVGLAHAFLHERLDRLQWVGVALATVGIVAIAAG